MYVTRISRYVTLYIAFGIIRCFKLQRQVFERIIRGYGGFTFICYRVMQLVFWRVNAKHESKQASQLHAS